MSTSWRQSLSLRGQKLAAKWMIKFGKLTHVDYTIEELNQLAAPLFPQSMAVDVPVGKGNFTVLEAQLDIPKRANRVHVQLFGSLDIDSANTPLYRAHVVAVLLLSPEYDLHQKSVSIGELTLDSIRLVNDEYSLLNDSKQIFDLVFPKRMQNLLTGTVKSALGLMTAGSSDFATDYLKMYLSGSKQKVLEYHKPQLIALIEQLKQDPEFVYEMDDSDWQQSLFRQYGQSVVVEDRCVRFKLGSKPVD